MKEFTMRWVRNLPERRKRNAKRDDFGNGFIHNLRVNKEAILQAMKEDLQEMFRQERMQR